MKTKTIAILLGFFTMEGHGLCELESPKSLEWRDENGIQKIETRELWEKKRRAIEEIMLDIFGEMPREKTPLKPATISQEDMGSYIRRKVSYESLPGEIVYAYLLIPKEIRENAPGILVNIHTCPEGKDAAVGIRGNPKRALGSELVELGNIVLVPDVKSTGERLASNGKYFDTIDVYQKYPQWSAIGLQIWENIRSVDYLLSVEKVDPERIGTIGHSHGGYCTMFALAFDERIKAGVSSAGLFLLSNNSRPFRLSRTEWWVGAPALRNYLHNGVLPFDMNQLVALCAPKWFLDISYEEDATYGNVPEAQKIVVEDVTPVWTEIYRKPERLEFWLLPGGHDFPMEIHGKAYKWLMDALNREDEKEDNNQSGGDK